MSNACSCDFDYVETRMYRAARHRAKKAHRCSECGAEIAPGETYERVRAIWDNEPATVRTCCDCLAIRDSLDTMECFCWRHEGLWDDIVSQFENADFPLGSRFAHMRLIVAHRAHRSKTKIARRGVSHD